MIRAVRLVAALLASIALLAAPAAADTGTVKDRVGDAVTGPEGPGLDITGARFDNGTERVVATVSFDSLQRGDLVVSVAPRGGGGLRLVSYYRPGKPARSFVVSGSFDDVGRGRVDCKGFRVTWNHRAATARLTMPSGCLAHAEYGELRFAVLTETSGGDTDAAPGHGDHVGRTPWIARG
jgi:hypothetical protein